MEEWKRDLMRIIGYHNGDDSELMQSLLKFRDTYLSDKELEAAQQERYTNCRTGPDPLASSGFILKGVAPSDSEAGRRISDDEVQACVARIAKPKIEYPKYCTIEYHHDKLKEIINHINEKQGG